MRRKFSITKRGVVKEGDTLVNTTSMTSLESQESTKEGISTNILTDQLDLPKRHRILMLGLEGVGKKELIQEFGADLSVYMQGANGKK